MNYPNLHKISAIYKIVLGSSSPRRKKLLAEIGIQFNLLSPNIFETQNEGEDPYDFAQRLAIDKAKSLQQNLNENELVIGCDTIVVLNNKVLGKPSNESEASEILNSLSSEQHFVCTALAIADRENVLAYGFDVTKVFFNNVSHQQIKDYISTKEPMDKAGAYGIQGMGAFLVDRIEGSLDTVIGLPRQLLEKLAGEILKLSE